MTAGTLPATLHKVVDPVVLEGLRVGVKALRLGDQLDLLVVVWSSAIRRNDCPLEVRVLEVGAGVVDGGLLPLLAFALLLSLDCSRRDLVHHVCSSVTNQCASLPSRATSPEWLCR